MSSDGAGGGPSGSELVLRWLPSRLSPQGCRAPNGPGLPMELPHHVLDAELRLDLVALGMARGLLLGVGPRPLTGTAALDLAFLLQPI